MGEQHCVCREGGKVYSGELLNEKKKVFLLGLVRYGMDRFQLSVDLTGGGEGCMFLLKRSCCGMVSLYNMNSLSLFLTLSIKLCRAKSL